MKHKDMVPLMGKIVTVKKRLIREEKGNDNYIIGPAKSILTEAAVESYFICKWISTRCKPWGGWIVGFTYKQDGQYSLDLEGSSFDETSRQLCVLVRKWPTMNPTPVPLDGYSVGGLPVSPNHKPLPEGFE